MKISIVITVLNEEKTIGGLLDSLLRQSKKADEIIVVDGGSSDRTVQIIKHYQKKDRTIKLLLEKGNIAHGRNCGIEVAGNDIIATTDAGCVPHKDWLERVTEPFLTHLGGDPAAAGPPSEEYHHAATSWESADTRQESPVDLVAGFYDMPAKTPMQKAISIYLGIHPKRYDPETFLPSTRSMAFKKQLWEEVGGFDEKLDKTGEDTAFVYNIVKTGARIVQVGEARVDWKELENITFKTAVKKFFDYAKGDAQSKIWRHPTKKLMSHNIKVILIFIRYLACIILLVFSVSNPVLLVLLVILAILYVLWPVWKWRDVIYDFRTKLWLPVIQISSDFAVMAGFISGIVAKAGPVRK